MYIKVKREWKYLYRAVDSVGNTLDFMHVGFYAKCKSIFKAQCSEFLQDPRNKAIYVMNADGKWLVRITNKSSIYQVEFFSSAAAPAA